jgi:hypothetical protein
MSQLIGRFLRNEARASNLLLAGISLVMAALFVVAVAGMLVII